MDFDVARVYTAANADELKVGSKVIVADTLGGLKNLVRDAGDISKLKEVCEEDVGHRFKVNDGSYALAYLVEKPAKLKWTDLKVGDVLTKDGKTGLVALIDSFTPPHIYIGGSWVTDEELEEWRR